MQLMLDMVEILRDEWRVGGSQLGVENLGLIMVLADNPLKG
jgi:hypothetical protein